MNINILYIVLIIAVVIVVYTIGFITSFQTCREHTVQKLVDMLLEDLGMEGKEDDK